MTMDKIKPILTFLNKERFWVSCILVLLVGGVFWWICAAGLRAEFAENNAKITGGYTQGNQIRSKPNHPNTNSEKEMKEVLRKLKISVQNAWTKQYNEQGEEIFVWPKGLGENFIRVVKPMRPIEKHVTYDAQKIEDNEEIDYGYRSDYANFIQSELPKLAEIVDSRWAPGANMATGGMETGGPTTSYDPASSTGEGGNAAAAAAEAEKPMVTWSPANQTEITFNRFDWSDRENRAPTSIELLYAQEDYWVLKSLLNIVKTTNAGANAYYNATIRNIEFIQMGRDARSDVGVVTQVTQAATAGGESEYDLSSQSSSSTDTFESSPETSMEDPSGIGGLAGVSVDPAEKRYVDQDYQPLSAEELRASTQSTDATKAYLSVAKRMPIRMRVTIDGRKIPKFLSACANAELTVEVRQIRVNRPPGLGATAGGTGMGGPTSSAGGGNAFEFGGSGSSGGSGGGNFGAADPYAGGGSGEGAGIGTAGVKASRFPFDVDLEIYGIVYIYNPVAKKQLEIEVAPSEGETTSPAETPAS